MEKQPTRETNLDFTFFIKRTLVKAGINLADIRQAIQEEAPTSIAAVSTTQMLHDICFEWPIDDAVHFIKENDFHRMEVADVANELINRAATLPAYDWRPTYSESADGIRINLDRVMLELRKHSVSWDDIPTFINEVWHHHATIEEGDQGVRKIDAKHVMNWLGY